MSHAIDFESEAYWNERYSSPTKRKAELFDWYCITFASLHGILSPLIDHTLALPDVTVAIVDVGCGNSPFLFDAAEHFYKLKLHAKPKLIGIDFSAVVIEQLKTIWANERFASIKPEVDLDFIVGDARRNIVADGSEGVGIVLDKATLDAVDCSGEGEDSEAVVLTAFGALVVGGYFVSLTCRPVARRLGTIRAAASKYESSICSAVVIEEVAVESLRNDPISPSHALIFQKKSK